MELKNFWRLPFGIIIGRSNALPSVTLASEIKTSYRGLESQESAHLGTVIKADSRINALSGAPDTRLAGMPNASSFAGRKSSETPNEKDFTTLWNSYGSQKHKFRTGIADIDLNNMHKMDFDALAELVADLSPEVSKALWDFLLLCNAGFEIKAYSQDNPDDINKRAQKEVNLMLETIGYKHGTLAVFFDRLFKTFFLRGAILLELVLDPNGRDFADIATPDPKTLVFRRIKDPIIGEFWTFGQKIDNKFVDLRIPTIRYVPLHPSPDSIEGTPLVTSVFFLAIFLMSVLRDVKRVVQHQGYMRLDVEVDFQKLVDTVPDEAKDNPEMLAAWMDRVVGKVQEVYSTLEPDDTYVHSDSVSVNRPVGTASADSLQAVDALFRVLERMSVRALKTMPLLLATDTTRGETLANREWEIYSKGIESVQHLLETPLSDLFTLALQAKGINAKVKVRFATFRAAERMRDAQVDLLQAQLARFLYDCGIISQDEMALLCGYESPDEEAPRVAESGSSPSSLQNVIQENPDQSDSRIAVIVDRIAPLVSDRFTPAQFSKVVQNALARNKNGKGE